MSYNMLYEAFCNLKCQILSLGSGCILGFFSTYKTAEIDISLLTFLDILVTTFLYVWKTRKQDDNENPPNNISMHSFLLTHHALSNTWAS